VNRPKIFRDSQKNDPERGAFCLGDTSLGSGPRIVFFARTVVPDARARDIAEVAEGRQLVHDAAFWRVVVEFTFHIGQRVHLPFGEREPVLREKTFAEGFPFGLRLHTGDVFTFTVRSVAETPWLLDIVQEHDKERVREGEWERSACAECPVEGNRQVHGFGDMVEVSARPVLVIVRGTPCPFERLGFVAEDLFACAAMGLIDEADELTDR